MLQVCNACGATQYPPRDACGACLSVQLTWKDVPPDGRLLAQTTVHASTDSYFRAHTPWRIGTVQLTAGPSVICHLHGDLTPDDPVRMVAKLDRAGQGVLFALPQNAIPAMEDDRQMREMTCDPISRCVLITDASNENTLALASALADAGAAKVLVGERNRGDGNQNRDLLEKLDRVEFVPLDVRDTQSVSDLAGAIGGETDMIINNARFFRPGGIVGNRDVDAAREEMDVNVFGMMRLAQAFGPAMKRRKARDDGALSAWVNILSVFAWSNLPALGAFSASNAAALSLSQCLRAELGPGGVRVMNVFTGPTDDAAHQSLPAPKVSPDTLADALVDGLKQGLEDVFVGEVAHTFIERWRAGPKMLEKEMTQGGSAT